MKRNLVFKLTFCFILFSVIVLGLLNSIGSYFMKSYLIQNKKNVLYNEATYISNEYLNLFTSNEYTLQDLTKLLKAVDQFIEAHIWLVNNRGDIICDTSESLANSVGKNINDYDPLFLNQTFVESTTLQGLMKEKSLCVVYPIPYNYTSRNYIVVFLPYQQIIHESILYTNILTICSLFFLTLLLLLFIYLYYMSARPLYKIRKAALEYGRGNFKYELHVRGHDEFHDVATALNYMANELQSFDEYQKKFIANISHDFRSPLTSIKGYAEAMLDGTIPSDIQQKYLDIIVFESERLNKLTNNLLELNGFDNNRNLLDVTSFDINGIIKKICTSFEGICTKKKIQFHLVFTDKELYVDADLGKIQQVLYNLIDNAIKFSNTNSVIKITSSQKGEKAFVSIKDYGVGIPKANIHKIWERFYKQDASRGKDKKGTGLGLSIAKEIILAHNETIDVISTEGVGTEFTFRLSLTEY